jgi:hypothetical protein
MHPDLESEQAYVDHAYACLEEMRRQMERAGEAGIGEIEALVLEAWATKRLVTFEDAERGSASAGSTSTASSGRCTSAALGARGADADRRQLAGAGRRAFYTGDRRRPAGVALRRRFRHEGRRLLDLYDEPLDGSAGDVVHGVADILLEELERSRDEHMRDIVATIQADQYRLITREPEGVLVIQGGPGTGQDGVGLHRASWLLYTYRASSSAAACWSSGPQPGLHGLHLARPARCSARRRVEQRAVNELVDGIEAVRSDTGEVARLKGRRTDWLR